MRWTELLTAVFIRVALGKFGRAAKVLIAASTAGWCFLSTAVAGELLNGAYVSLTERARENTGEFYVYQTMDSGLNHGFPSQFFGTAQPTINAACIDDPNSSSGCATRRASLDKSGTVFQVNFDSIAHGGKNAFGGFNFVEPEHYNVAVHSRGYDLRGTQFILFSARSPSPQGISLQFGAGRNATTKFATMNYSPTYVVICVAVHGLAQQVCPPIAKMQLDLDRSIELKRAHILFTVVTNHANAPRGGIVLLKRIHYAPFPASQLDVPSLPLSTQTFGIVPVTSELKGRVPVPDDQANRNVAALYEASLSAMAFFNRGSADDLKYGYGIADSLVYALRHDNAGDPLPGKGGLHDGYESGDLALLNSQGVAKHGQVRLAGFTASTSLCGPAAYCLVLDGATGGNNAFAILALVRAYEISGKSAYLGAASQIGNWIWARLLDERRVSFGGFFVGYPDDGVPNKKVERGKSTENNADIFSAFSQLANANMRLGENAAEAQWTSRAKIAGDFVIGMFDSSLGCFNAGTVPKGTPAGPGIDPDGPVRGRDVTNTYPFFDSNSFTYLALSRSLEYKNAVDWSKVAVCLAKFAQTAEVQGSTYNGYDIVQKPDCSSPPCGPNGIGWEFTGQAAVVINLSGGDTKPIIRQIADAQLSAPFGDGRGLAAATMQHGDTLAPYDQCLSTPFQCIPERVGIAATSWAIFADTHYNPLWQPQTGRAAAR